MLRHDAPNGISRPARRERHDHGDRSRRIVLRPSNSGDSSHRGGGHFNCKNLRRVRSGRDVRFMARPPPRSVRAAFHTVPQKKPTFLSPAPQPNGLGSRQGSEDTMHTRAWRGAGRRRRLVSGMLVQALLHCTALLRAARHSVPVRRRTGPVVHGSDRRSAGISPRAGRRAIGRWRPIGGCG